MIGYLAPGDFRKPIGDTQTFQVIAAVTKRYDLDEREPYVLLRSETDDVWLPWGQAELVAQVIEGSGHIHPDGVDISSFFDVVRSADSIELRGRDPRQGDLIVPFDEAHELAQFLREAASTVATVEDIDELP